MATGLAASIKTALDLPSTLVDGHNGIMEVTLGSDIVWTNQGTCANPYPGDNDVVALLGKATGISPRKGAHAQPEDVDGPACPLPTVAPAPAPFAMLSDSGCGCGPMEPLATIDTGCCTPEPGKKDPKRCC